MIDEDASDADRGTLENTPMVGVLFVLVCKFVTPPSPREPSYGCVEWKRNRFDAV